MTTELDQRVILCWDLAQRDRDSYSPSFREFLDKIFLKRLYKCNGVSWVVGHLEYDLKNLAQAVDEIQYIGPSQLSVDI